MGSKYQVFLRHAETKINPNKPTSEWVLTQSGRNGAKSLSTSKEFPKYNEVYTSNEPKAIATAKPFAARINTEVRTLKGLGELDRSATYAQSRTQYNQMVKEALTDRGTSVLCWETAKDALNRFSNAVEEIISGSYVDEVLIVAHGIVLTLYFAKLEGKLDNAFERWKKLRFLDWGITSNGRVVRDIDQQKIS
jgi:broad specificity phosphatase PhoE